MVKEFNEREKERSNKSNNLGKKTVKSSVIEAAAPKFAKMAQKAKLAKNRQEEEETIEDEIE